MASTLTISGINDGVDFYDATSVEWVAVTGTPPD